MITATGLGSGLDISGLVDQLVAAERAGSDLQLSRQQSRYNAKFSALGSLKSALSTFQSSLSSINTLSNYSKNTATSSDKSVLTVSANSDAIANVYSMEVSQLASSHGLASGTFADTDETAVGTGSLTIRFGNTDYDAGTDTYNSFTLNADKSAATIDIDSSNNTLEGIMTAINDADIGVSASIVNDGSGFRLLMRSQDTGEANSLEIAVSDDDGNDTDGSGLSQLAFNASATHMEQTAAAEDAQFSINGLAVSNATNSVDSAIPGVSMTLKKVSESPVTLTVGQDTGAVTNSIKNFVAGYNKFVSTANALSAYDAENDVPSALVGDFTLRSIEGQVDRILRSTPEGFSGAIGTLAELGISTSSSGTLEFDESRFMEVWEESPDDVMKMFAAYGTPSDENISFNGASDATVTGDYAVEITTLASYGYHTGASVLPDFGGGGSLVIDSDNNNLSLEIDSIDIGEITLTAATYTTGDDLAGELQAQINGTTAMREADKTVTVSYDSASDSFTITSDVIGSTSAVNILAVDTNTAAQLGFSVGSGVDGVDVEGTIDGVAAKGAGDVLIAEEGSDAEGLSLVIGGTTTGSRGDISFTRGVTSQFDQLLESLLAEEGALTERIDSYQDRLDDVEERREELELRWEKVRARYADQFNALDTLMGQLQNTSNYLEGQLANLPKPNSVKSNS